MCPLKNKKTVCDTFTIFGSEHSGIYINNILKYCSTPLIFIPFRTPKDIQTDKKEKIVVHS